MPVHGCAIQGIKATKKDGCLTNDPHSASQSPKTPKPQNPMIIEEWNEVLKAIKIGINKIDNLNLN